MENKELLQSEQQPQEQGQSNDDVDIFTAQGIRLAMQTEGTVDSDPESLADALLNIITRVETEGEKNGIVFPIEAVLAGGIQVLQAMLVLWKMQPDENTIRQIVGIVVGRYIQNKMKTGKLTKEQIMQLAQQAQQNMPQQNEAVQQ